MRRRRDGGASSLDALLTFEKFRQIIGEDLSELKIRGARLLGRFVGKTVYVVAGAAKKKASKLPKAAFKRARRILEINNLEHLEVKGRAN